jgi:aminopeptidase N
MEVSNEKRRKKFGLPEKDLMLPTTDAWGLSRNYVSKDGDWISFEATVSTSGDQIALAPGELVAEWTEEGRNYYTYKNDYMINFYTFVSARYAVKRDTFVPSIVPIDTPITLEIYYHPTHTYNLDNMMTSLKESLTYYIETFGEYPHNILRIAEFPRYYSFAQSFSTLIPFSEAVGFIADVKEGKFNYPFYITAHETAHQWFAHQVIPGFTRGALMIGESITDYLASTVVKKNTTDKLFREYLEYNLDQYAMSRSYGSRAELPLSQVEMQQYLAYQKGMLTFNSAKRLLDEETLNKALQEFFLKNKYTYNPYTNTAEFLKTLDPYIPDSLKTIFDDMFNKVVAYNNKLEKVTSEETDTGTYKNTVTFTFEKRYFDKDGKPEILEIAEWVEIGLLDSDKNILKLEKVYVAERENTVEIMSETKPAEIVLDPYFVLMDVTAFDNREKVK